MQNVVRESDFFLLIFLNEKVTYHNLKESLVLHTRNNTNLKLIYLIDFIQFFFKILIFFFYLKLKK